MIRSAHSQGGAIGGFYEITKLILNFTHDTNSEVLLKF